MNPGLVLPLLPQIGLNPLIDLSFHYLNLAAYSGLYPLGKSLEPWTKNLSPQQHYYYQRYLEAWQYGSGGDY